MNASTLKKAIAQTIITTSHDDTRPVLTGVLCHSHEGSLYFAATDGYRLAERKLVAVKDTISALIPASTLADVARVIPDETDEIEMLIDDSQVRFRIDDIEVTSRLIDGKFPDYRQLIPNDTEIHVVVNKAELSRITKIASLFARESGGSVTIKTDASDKTISIHSIASQLGENTSETNADVDADGAVTLNSRYLTEALGCFDDDIVNFGFSGKLAPCVVSSTNKDSDYKHIVMPLRS
jgi:DNA polymerase-3 subunit beta